MKAILTVLTLMSLTTAAHASWFQEYCSDAEGTVRRGSGHDENFLQITQRVWGEDGKKDTILRDENGALTYNEKSNKVVEKEYHENCRPGEEIGFATSREVNLVQLEIQNSDGRLFDKDIVGVSKDLKTVNATLICERNYGGEMLCPKK